MELVEANTKGQVKIKEANEILEKLGLEGLKLSERDFNDIYSTRHKKREVDFYKDDGLKTIKFKEFMGSAEIVEGLSTSGGKKITVYFEWDGSNKFPNNMKFTFENIHVSKSIDLMNKAKNKTIKI